MVIHKTTTLILPPHTRSFTDFVHSHYHTNRLTRSTYPSSLGSTTWVQLQGGRMAATNASPHLSRSPCFTMMNQGLYKPLNHPGYSILLPKSGFFFIFYSWTILLFFIHTHYSFNPCLDVSFDTFICAFPHVFQPQYFCYKSL